MTSYYKNPETGHIALPGQVVNGMKTYIGAKDEAWAKMGYFPFTPEPVDDESIDTTPVVQFSKLKIIRKMKDLGLAELFIDWVEADKLRKAEWYASQYLASDDEAFNDGLDQFITTHGMTREQVELLLIDCHV